LRSGPDKNFIDCSEGNSRDHIHDAQGAHGMRAGQLYRKILFTILLEQVIEYAFELSKGVCRGYADVRRGPGPGC
jgi:hypothetical protein